MILHRRELATVTLVVALSSVVAAAPGAAAPYRMTAGA